MWKLASGPDVQLTGDLESWRRVRRAADHLMVRYNPVGGFICAPKELVYYDSSAACCAACGMIEIAKAVPEYEKNVYLNAAMNILMAVESNFADWSEDSDYVITNSSTTAYQYEQNINIIYTDYFYTEAIYKLKGFEPLFW